MLSYPGVAFSFAIPESADGLNQSEDYIKYLSKANAPSCMSMALFKGNNWSEVSKSLFDETSFELEGSNPVLDCAIVDNDLGTCLLNFGYHPNGSSSYKIVINSSTMQDIIMALGPPSERFFKEDSRLSIHNPMGSDEKDQATLFFNYFSLGLDICFDTSVENATVKKLVLHGNIPGSIPFQKYHRCRWKLVTDEDQPTSEDRFSDYYQYPPNAQPMLLNRSFDSLSNSMELIGDSSDYEKPAEWALTDLYGLTGIVFEVMKNNCVVSLTLY